METTVIKDDKKYKIYKLSSIN